MRLDEIQAALQYLTPAGADELCEFLTTARNALGDDWLEAVQEENPHLVFVVDLVLNRTADEAFAYVCRQFGAARLYKKQLYDLHRRLNEEFRKPRGFTVSR
jgi:hypothetical protein